MPPKEPAIDQRIMKALSHPLRVRMLTLLNQKVASPSELGDELDEPLGNVSYHMRFLADLQMVKLARTAPRTAPAQGRGRGRGGPPRQHPRQPGRPDARPAGLGRAVGPSRATARARPRRA